MAFNYVVTAQKPTAVFNCVSGNFTGPKDLNLILDKLVRLEIYLVTPEGFRSLKEVPIHGRIQVMQKFRMPNEHKDYLFILTSKHNVFILEINRDPERGDFELKTLAHGLIAERIGHPSESGAICVINPKAGLIALRIYDGIFNIIKLDFKNKEIKSFNIRMEETNVTSFVFLNGYDMPTLCMLYQKHQSRHLRTYEITDEKEFRRGPWKQDNVESESNILIPVDEELGGVIVIGQKSIVYILDQNTYTAIAPPTLKQSNINCYCYLDKTRFLIGGMSGRLSILILCRSDDEDTKMNGTSSPYTYMLKLIELGEISIPQSLTYLDNNYIFVGSRMGDSQLVKFNLEANEAGNYIEIVDSYVNLAPIVDMVVVDLNKQGQDQLVTCSGYHKEGSIRIIRNGIGINEHATIDLPGIKGIWQLKVKSPYDSLIAISFVGQTKLLQLIDEEVEETHLDGFECLQQTLFCGNITLNEKEIILQATSTSFRLICPEEGRLISEWIPTQNISFISTNYTQILCSSRSNLYYLEIVNGQIKLISESQLDYEASCLDISQRTHKKSQIAAIGLSGNISVRIISVPDLKLLNTEKLGGEMIPRSLLMTHLDLTRYLFIAIGDGSLLYYILDNETGTLSERKKIILGTRATQLKAFKDNSSASYRIFVCSEQPTFIYSSNNKLVFSNVNLKEVHHMCTFNSAGYPNSLILTNDTQLLIGQIDQIQKLHIRTIPLGETPRRIAYQESTQTFGLITMRHDIHCKDGQVVPSRTSASSLAPNRTYSSSLPSIVKPSSLCSTPSDQQEVEVYHLLIIDQTTFKVMHAHQFMVKECAISITSAKLGDDPNDYFIVGTSFINQDELEPKMGRIVVFHLTDGKLQQVSEKEIKGSPYVIQEFKGKLLTAINSTIRLFEWTKSHDLHNECTFFNSIASLYLKTKGDTVIVGDVLRSITLLIYKSLGGHFEQIAADLDTSWLTFIEIIDDDTFIGSDSSFNLFTVSKDISAVADAERKRLLPVGHFHLGDHINVMKHGSLVMNHPSHGSCPILNKPILYGSYSGAIGLIAQVPESFYDFLLKLQKNITKTVKTAGNIDYAYWRTFSNEKKSEAANNFIDGDIIESFLDLNRSQMAECIENLTIEDAGVHRPATVDDIIKTVEELSHIH